MEEEIKDTKSDEHSRDYSVKLLLFFGFCGIIGLLTTAIIGIPLPFAFVFVVFAGVGLPCGLIRLTKKERKIKPIVISLIASILLLPVYIPIGIGIGFLAPLLPSYVKIFFTGPNVVQSVMSPDGNFEAYVVEAPSIDPPNQSLLIQRSDNIHFLSIADLAEDIDSIREIHW
ncbi:MAG: ETRAMP family protein, partial [Planctomycetota bacterium]